MNTEDEDLRLVEQAATKLGEQFDAVRIFASRHEATESGGTVAVTYGVGNEFAQLGQAALWVKKQELEDDSQ